MKNLSESSFEERLELYFEWAVTAWLMLKDEAGLIAALAAAKTFNSTDRQIIITVLDNLHTEWSRQDSENLFQETIKSLSDLKDIIMAKDWTVEDGVAERERLKMVNPEYAEALAKGDPEVFSRKYPNHFIIPFE
jgi:ABC-type sugar transport system substrate-binding protein